MSHINNIKGELACLKFEMKALEKHYIVSKPTAEARYDRVLDDGKRLYRIQIKYADYQDKNSNGSVSIHIEKFNHKKPIRYTSQDVDVIVAYIPKVDKLCWIPSNVFEGKTQLALRYELPRNGQVTNVHLINDFIWE